MWLPTSDVDQRVRLAAFTFLDRLRQSHEETLPYAPLIAGFEFDGRRLALLAPQGISKPAVLTLPLSISTAPPSPRKPRPYEHEFGTDGRLRSRCSSCDVDHRDNAGHQVTRQVAPLVYWHGFVPSRYRRRSTERLNLGAHARSFRLSAL